MRTTSTSFKAAALVQNTGEVPVLLVTIDHDNFSEPIRVSTDNADTFDVDGTTTRGTTSNGNNYIFYPMEIVLPDDSDESYAQASLTIDNIDRSILAAVRAITDSPSVSMQVVLASSPDTVEAEFSNFEFDSISADSLTVTGSLSLGHYYAEPFPGPSMLPSNFPGAF